MALMVASRRLTAGYWCVSAEHRQGPALLRVLRNSPRAMPLPANSGPASDDALGSRAIQHKAHHATD